MSDKTSSLKIPIYMKYSKLAAQSWLDPNIRLRPSDLTKPALDVNPDDYPLITQFNNIMDNTVQMHSTVDIDQPIFEPAPKIFLFEEYEAFANVRKKLYFRNKDSVSDWWLLPNYVFLVSVLYSVILTLGRKTNKAHQA